jgi:TolB-like protein/class 3 adenylate cyclase/tetratricopeptide (TPR) repeat protein
MSGTDASDPIGKSPDRRKLIAVVYADMVGYSRLIGLDDAGTVERLRTLRRNLIDPAIEEHGGRIVQTGGDSLLIVFDSIDGAVRCAVKVQQRVPFHDGDQFPDRAIRFRVGINIGDAIADGTDLHGDAVNVAARLQAECPPGSICVSRSVRDHVQGRLNLEFEELGSLNLKNIARPVEAFVVRQETVAFLPRSVEQRLPLPDKPSIAVLPFTNMSGDPEQEYFADGIVEEIITALARMPALFVIARNSSFAYKGRSPDIRQVGRELGVRYVLEGGVRKSVTGVRITAQLIAADTGTHLWADRYDGSLNDIFRIQDDVASGVVGAIEPELQRAEIERVTRKPTDSLDAYDLYLRAISQFHLLTSTSLGETLRLLKRALHIDPSYAPAAALAGWCRTIQGVQGWLTGSEIEIAETIALAHQAIESGKNDPDALWMAGYSVSYFAGEHASGVSAIERALHLNPNSAHAWMARGYVHFFVNEPWRAVEALQRAMRLSPLDPLAYVSKFGLGLAYLAGGDYEVAMTWVDRALGEQPRLASAVRSKAALSALLGHMDEAKKWGNRLLALDPNFTISAYIRAISVFSDPKIVVTYDEALRKAGLPAS